MTDRIEFCAFCGKSQTAVAVGDAGPCICDACIVLAVQRIAEWGAARMPAAPEGDGNRDR